MIQQKNRHSRASRLKRTEKPKQGSRLNPLVRKSPLLSTTAHFLRPIALSDESDFDNADEDDSSLKRGKNGRTSKPGQKTGNQRGSRKRESVLLKEELEVADDDSQTFAGFKMRIAAQEKTRIENERYSQQSAHRKEVINVDTDEEDFEFDGAKKNFKSSPPVQGMRSDPAVFPDITSYLHESIPYFDLKRTRREIVYEDEEEDADEKVEVTAGLRNGESSLSGTVNLVC